jgi:ankyrin repeat protein
MKPKTPYKIALLAGGLGVLVYAAILGARIITYTEGHFGRGAGDLALARAVEEGDRTLVRVLLAVGVSPDFIQPGGGISAVTAAAYRGDLWALEKLLKHGANPNGADLIVDNFTDPDKRINYDPTKPMPILYMDRPIFWAAKRQKREAVALLREYGAKYEFVDALLMGDEEFVRAALNSQPELGKALVRIRPDLLGLAIEFVNLPAIELMLDLGFDPNEHPKYGSTPYERAKQMNRTELLELFDARPAPTE